jgi:hypothetical protein
MKQSQQCEPIGRVWRGEESAAAVARVGCAGMGTTIGLAPLASDLKNCQWIYRFRANPGMLRGGVLPPAPVWAPGSALGSRPRVARSTSQAAVVSCGPRPAGHSGPGRPLVKRGGTIPLELRAQPRIGYQDPELEEDGPRGAGFDACYAYVIKQ